MPLISDPGNTLSLFPLQIDALPVVRDGTGVDSLTTATLFNTVETALYQLEKHTQQVIHILASTEDRHRVVLTGSVVVATPQASVTLTLVLPAAALAFLGSQPFRMGSMLLADVVCPTVGTAVFTDVSFTDSTGVVTVTARAMDYQDGATVPAGAYRFSVTILGRG